MRLLEISCLVYTPTHIGAHTERGKWRRASSLDPLEKPALEKVYRASRVPRGYRAPPAMLCACDHSFPPCQAPFLPPISSLLKHNLSSPASVHSLTASIFSLFLISLGKGPHLPLFHTLFGKGVKHFCQVDLVFCQSNYISMA